MFNAPRPSQPYGSSSSNPLGASFVNENPLVTSIYDDGLDPWSSAPSPAPPPLSAFPSTSAGFSAVIGEASMPPVYSQAFNAVDDTNSGEISVSALSRVLGTSALSASTVDKIVSLVSTRPRVSRLEFYVALALAALAQSGKDLSIERVAALAQENALPVPNLDVDALIPSTSTFLKYTHDDMSGASLTRGLSADDPWNTSKSSSAAATSPMATNGVASSTINGAPSSLSGTGLPREWWKKQETVYVNVLGQQGFLLNRYLVYEVSSDRGPPVPRRYSEFVFLWDCLAKRYPFRLLPALPPKRIGPDESFLEQRRKGLARFLNFVINHPVLTGDGLLVVFLSEPSFEAWRKHSSVSLDDESNSKRVDKLEEMGIPSDLDDKLALVRNKVPFLVEHWQRICMLVERTIRRKEAEAADLSRLTNNLKSLVEENAQCWRGQECQLCDGVKQGLAHFANHTQKHSDLLEHRSRTMLYSISEALKGQRDLYIALRDLFIRHERLAVDQVDRMKKRVETNSMKLETARQVHKDGWEQEADKITMLIEKDQASIASQLNRRVFIRACMWHEMRVVLHNRENTLLTQAAQGFAREEVDFSEGVMSNWASLVDAIADMPNE